MWIGEVSSTAQRSDSPAQALIQRCLNLPNRSGGYPLNYLQQFKDSIDAGLIVMTAFISPFRAEREMARELIGTENFIEVFVDTPLEVCERRNPKGLYKKARSGQLPNMTGINSPYETPSNPDLVINSTVTNTVDYVIQISRYLAGART